MFNLSKILLAVILLAFPLLAGEPDQIGLDVAQFTLATDGQDIVYLAMFWEKAPYNRAKPDFFRVIWTDREKEPTRKSANEEVVRTRYRQDFKTYAEAESLFFAKQKEKLSMFKEIKTKK